MIKSIQTTMTRSFPTTSQSTRPYGQHEQKRDCWDNSVAENFFNRLKDERVHWGNYQTRREAKQDIQITLLCFITIKDCIRFWII